MSIRRLLPQGIVLAFAMTSPAAIADSFRCGAYIAVEGMPAAELTEKCGEPELTRTFDEPVYAERPNGSRYQLGVTTSHYWYYERGRNEFVARVTVRKSVAEKIELLSVRDIASVPDD